MVRCGLSFSTHGLGRMAVLGPHRPNPTHCPPLIVVICHASIRLTARSPRVRLTYIREYEENKKKNFLLNMLKGKQLERPWF
jgi:hypothetical protein